MSKKIYIEIMDISMRNQSNNFQSPIDFVFRNKISYLPRCSIMCDNHAVI